MDVGELSVNQEEEDELDGWAVDDLTGKELDLRMVPPRREEVESMNSLGAFEEVDVGGVRPEDGQGSDHNEVDRYGQGV